MKKKIELSVSFYTYPKPYVTLYNDELGCSGDAYTPVNKNGYKKLLELNEKEIKAMLKEAKTNFYKNLKEKNELKEFQKVLENLVNKI